MNNMGILMQNLSNNDLVNLYSLITKELRNRKVVRSKNIIGDLGEHILKNHFNVSKDLPNLILMPPSNKSIDAIDIKNKTYAIKTTTGKTTSVFYGLNPPEIKEENQKLFDYLLILKLNENFEICKIYQLEWENFLTHKKWHSRMQAWNISINKQLEKFNIFQ